MNPRRSSRNCLRFCLVAVVLLVSCRPAPREEAPAPGAPGAITGGTVQGLDASEIRELYHLPEGSEIFPLAWFLALERDDSPQLFAEDLERFGFLDDPEGPHGLPVGLTAHPTRDTKFLGSMVGVSCAACHVTEWDSGPLKVRVLGGPSQLDIELFYGDLAREALETATKAPRLVRFVARLGLQELVGGSADAGFAAPSSDTRDAVEAWISMEMQRPDAAETPALDALQAALEAQAAASLVDPSSTLADVRPETTDPIESAVEDYRRAAPVAMAPAAFDDALASLAEKIPAPGTTAERRTAVRSTFADFLDKAALLQARVAFLRRLGTTHEGDVVPGPGRVDAFGNARNFLFPDDSAAKTAPVSYPHLWGFGEFPRLHWDGNTTSVTQRNIGQALGLGAVVNPAHGHVSTILPRSIHRLETLTRKLTPPPWPFGGVDTALADRGRQLFAAECASCHPKDGAASTLGEVGTDPARAESFARPVGGVPFHEALATTLAATQARAFQDAGISQAEGDEMQYGRLPPRWQTSRKYVSRPLAGVWATAPYLHDGSVPTLADLLAPAAQRPKAFTLRGRSYDTQRVGAAYDATADTAAGLDTTLAGNSNAGHEYGTALPPADVQALLDYLKTL